MAAIAGDLSRKILGHSDANKAFRPWWDNIEDNCLYAFVVIGKVEKILEGSLDSIPLPSSFKSWAGKFGIANITQQCFALLPQQVNFPTSNFNFY